MTRFETGVELRWSDLDALRHVNNGAYVDFLQEARVGLLLSGPDGTGPVRELLGGGVLVAAHQVAYLRPMTSTRTPLRVSMWTEKIGAARFTVGYELFDRDRSGVETLVCSARSVLCPFDLSAQRVRRLSPDERAFFESVRDDAAEPMRPLAPATRSGLAVRGDLRVRWGDLDSYGHVNNVRYFDYFQEGRLWLLDRARDSASAGPYWVVARQDVRYLEQLNHRLEPYRLSTEVTHLGRTSMRLDATITDPRTDTVHATCSTVCVATDRDGRSVSIGDDFRARV
ncbi:acyl-CoA thioester hydrolase [Naumannella cuiyingiana]|uniref:Acyl-CoA thioester hydrolase n=1 Tax=Naumannella cuiyingiana TaxID=1347891 RepID=A0A7Z0D741_9ACTN|nr:thioesterase family protein [Naumannella cuiyingiana]NYI70106.1 acyl-CoA thioester hydrolase [Naumannella cuiyingiana]